MIDATGKSVDDFGNILECWEVGSKLARYCTLIAEGEVEIVSKNGTIVHKPLPTSLPLGIGLCLPSSCSREGILDVQETILHLLPVDIPFVEYTVTCMEPTHWQWKTWVAVALVAFLGLLCIIGTAVDLLWNYLSELKLKQRSGVETLPQRGSTLNADVEAVPLIQSGRESPLTIDETPVARIAPWEKQLLTFVRPVLYYLRPLNVFSVVANTISLFKHTPGELNALNGLRSLMMFWIILGHSGEWFEEVSDNSIYIKKSIEKQYIFQGLAGAYFGVDGFFYLSGFLVGWGLLRELQKKGKFNVILYVVHRFLRIWPVYIFMMIVYLHISIYLGEGYIWERYSEYVSQRCDKWWTDLLFINNFYPKNFNEQCMGWSWYLANDMQFYLFVAPILIFVYYWHKALGLIMLASSLGFSIFIAIFLAWYFNLSGNPYNNTLQYMNQIYSKPYTRVSPYLVGIFFAYLLVKTGTKLPWRTVKVRALSYGLVLLSLPCFYIPIFTTNLTWNRVEDLTYTGFSRPVEALAFGLLMHACFIHQDGLLNRFFSHAFFTPLARLTFAAYLFHPLVIWFFYMNRSRPLHFSTLDLVFYYLANLLLSYIGAYVISLLIEKPFMNIEKLIFKPPKRTPKPAALPASEADVADDAEGGETTAIVVEQEGDKV